MNKPEAIAEFMDEQYEHALRPPAHEAEAVDKDESKVIAGEPWQFIEVELPSNQVCKYEDVDSLSNDVIIGKLKKKYRARRVTIAPHDQSTTSGDLEEEAKLVKEESDWTIVGKLPELRSVYSPRMGNALDYIWPGVLVGAILKAIDTTYFLFSVEETAGMLWLFTLGCLVASTRFGWIPIALYFFVTFKFFGQVPNFFLTAIATGLVGGFFGAPLGMLVGTIVGHFKAKRLAQTVDLNNEGIRPYLLCLALPAVFLAVTLPLYVFWLTPLIFEMLA